MLSGIVVGDGDGLPSADYIIWGFWARVSWE